MENKIKPIKCPKCKKNIIPEVDARLKIDVKHKKMEEEGSPFSQHTDVWYRCKTENCDYRCHQTYKKGKLVSESF